MPPSLYFTPLCAPFSQAQSSERFRDSSDDVRALVVTAIGEWAASLPERFLVDEYLKYIAWALSDRAGPVRLAAVEALLGLLGSEERASAMHEFLARFRQRFLEMVDDVDEGVVAKVLALLSR